MKNKSVFLIVPLLLLFLVFLSPGFLTHHLNAEKKDSFHIAICYPSIGSVKSLEGLIQQGFIPEKGLKITGVYHTDEVSDYERSEQYVKNKKLSWITFVKVSARINPEKLFQENACTPHFKKIFQTTDGIIFFGGADIPPYLYGKKVNLLTQIRTPYRHFFELSFIFHLLGGNQNKDFIPFLENRPDYPVLGICLGAQSLNVGTGGTLVQDIWMETYGKTTLEDVIALGRENWHTNPYARLYPEKSLMSYNLHPIEFKENSTFCTELGFKKTDRPLIISSHHQAVDTLGQGFRAAAFSLDGKVIEAIEHERYPRVLGTQFHPEFPLLWDENNTFRLVPGEEEFIVRNVLEKRVPSFAFHKAIWAWFVKAVTSETDS